MAETTISYDAIKVGATTTTVLNKITDVSQDDSKSETDSVYVGKSIAVTTAGARTVGFNITIDWDSSDTNHKLLETAYETDAKVKLDVIIDETAVSGEQGKTWTCLVTSFQRGLSPTGVKTVTMKLRPVDVPVAL